MASKKVLQAFNNRVIKAVKELGGVVKTLPFDLYQLEIETKAGKLNISVHEATKASDVFSIFCRFEDVDKANKVLSEDNSINLNRYSGKWNFHYLGADSCFDVFVMSLKEIM